MKISPYLSKKILTHFDETAPKWGAIRNPPRKRKGPGQPKKTPTITRSVRTTRKGWVWLKKAAKQNGHTSVGKWAAAEAHNNPSP